MHVLVTTDGTQQSLKATRFLGNLVNPATVAKITVLAVIRPLAAVPFANEFEEGEAKGDGSFTISFRREAQAAVERVAAEMKGLAPVVETTVRAGSPADEIIRVASEIDADLIVVGGRGKSVVGAILIGSVAYRVLHHAPCPVLVTR
ncbi:universal stress protein [Marinivivus vitaminiproducens]|uniref:universal stress protein n=1 Tax=Marinivivus vitaminiproducens TaxID=3035935 RepID=UPI00279ABFD6|nr:universal stress protein [Geminicoccaceae bacterium SCSIO 64248]